MLQKELVLDKGFVSLISALNDDQAIRLLERENPLFLVRAECLLDHASASFLLKCPLFVQLNLSKTLQIMDVSHAKVEAYVPSVADIAAGSVEDSSRIHQYMQATTEALLLNRESMPMDGADRFISQMLMPISTFNTIVVTGSLRQWLNFINQTKLPAAIESYRITINNILLAHWKNLGIMVERKHYTYGEKEKQHALT